MQFYVQACAGADYGTSMRVVPYHHPSVMPSWASSRVSMAAVASDARNCGPIHFTGYALVKFQCMSSTPAASYITIDTLRRLNLPLAISPPHFKYSFDISILHLH